MRRHPLSLILAFALSLSLLPACGGTDGGPSSSSAASGSEGGSASASASNVPEPDISEPNVIRPDDGSVSAPDVSEPDVSASLSLNKSDFTLRAPGASYKLKYAAASSTDGLVSFSSSDASVATVDQDGTVTAVAPGTATITARSGELTAQCVVRCRWEEKTGDEEPDGSGASSAAPSGKVDLAAFYSSLASSFPSSMALADQEVQEAFYPGLSDIATDQCLVYANLMSLNMGELVLVQVKDGKDVDAVRAILQARVDHMVNGGAWYPEPTRVWSECSAVVSNGNYIMMVVLDEYQSIVNDFNALF